MHPQYVFVRYSVLLERLLYPGFCRCTQEATWVQCEIPTAVGIRHPSQPVNGGYVGGGSW